MPRAGTAQRAGRAQRALVAVILAALAVAGCGGPPGATIGPPSQPAPTGPGASAAPSLPRATEEPATAEPPATPAPLPPGSWARLSPDGDRPTAREDHTWTVAEDGATAYLFGGRDGSTLFDDLWAYDLRADRWTRLAVSGGGPAPRFGHEGAWIPGRGLAVFAGQAGPRFFDDLWLFDPSTGRWTELPAGDYAPVPRYGSCSGLGPDGRLWISHGFTEDGVRFSDTHAYDFDAATWTDQFPGSGVPVARCLHACWWTGDGRFVLYGGQTTGVPALGDLWVLEPGAPGTHRWTEVGGDLPAARQLAAVARGGGVTIVLGGRGRNGQPRDDGWQLVDGAAGFVPLEADGELPPARSGGALIHDSGGERLLLFGGLAADELADLWAFTWR